MVQLTVVGPTAVMVSVPVGVPTEGATLVAVPVNVTLSPATLGSVAETRPRLTLAAPMVCGSLGSTLVAKSGLTLNTALKARKGAVPPEYRPTGRLLGPVRVMVPSGPRLAVP